MRQRKPKINWFLIGLLVLMIAVVTYIDRYILPTAQTPFIPTATATRNPESYLSEAEALFNEGKLLQAINTYLEAVRIQPDNPSTYIALARVQVFAGNYEDAQISAEDALLLNPNNSSAYAVLGWALTLKGEYVSADDALKNALRIDPGNGLAHAYNAFLYGKMYEFNAGPYVDPIQTAIDESKTALTLAPDSLEAHWARAYIFQLTSVENREQAIQEYLAAIAINPKISEIHLELGTVYKAISSYGDAIKEYNLANTLNPTDYRPNLYSSRAEFAATEYGKAEQYAKLAVSTLPTDAYLRGNWGYMLYKNNDLLSALEQLQLAVEGGSTSDGQVIQPISPTSDDLWIAKYYYVYGYTLAMTDQCADALLLTQKILNYFRTDPLAQVIVDDVLSYCSEHPGTNTSPPAATP
jgi:tetratricopeptide (TPR) repeat protein